MDKETIEAQIELLVNKIETITDEKIKKKLIKKLKELMKQLNKLKKLKKPKNNYKTNIPIYVNKFLKENKNYNSAMLDIITNNTNKIIKEKKMK